MAREVYVDQDACIGCELCTAVAPELFRLSASSVAEVHGRIAASEAKAQEAIDGCPVGCIHWR